MLAQVWQGRGLARGTRGVEAAKAAAASPPSSGRGERGAVGGPRPFLKSAGRPSSPPDPSGPPCRVPAPGLATGDVVGTRETQTPHVPSVRDVDLDTNVPGAVMGAHSTRPSPGLPGGAETLRLTV